MTMNIKKAKEMGIEEGYSIARKNLDEYLQVMFRENMNKIEFCDFVVQAVAEYEVRSRSSAGMRRSKVVSVTNEWFGYMLNRMTSIEELKKQEKSLFEAYESGIVAGAKIACKEVKEYKGWILTKYEGVQLGYDILSPQGRFLKFGKGRKIKGWIAVHPDPEEFPGGKIFDTIKEAEEYIDNY